MLRRSHVLALFSLRAPFTCLRFTPSSQSQEQPAFHFFPDFHQDELRIELGDSRFAPSENGGLVRVSFTRNLSKDPARIFPFPHNSLLNSSRLLAKRRTTTFERARVALTNSDVHARLPPSKKPRATNPLSLITERKTLCSYNKYAPLCPPP